MKVEYAILLAAVLIAGVIFFTAPSAPDVPTDEIVDVVELGKDYDTESVSATTRVSTVYYITGSDVGEVLEEAATKGYNQRRHMDLVSNGSDFILVFNVQ